MRFYSKLLPQYTRKTRGHSVMSLLQNCTSSKHFLQVQAFFIKTSLHLNSFVQAKLLGKIISLSSPNDLHYARSIFNSISLPDTFIWNTMIRGYLNAQNPKESATLFFQMRVQADILVDSFSLSLVLQACGKLFDSVNGRRIHTYVVKLGFGPDLFVQTALIEMYAKCNCVEDAGKVLSLMDNPDLVSYNVLLAEFIRVGEIKLAHELFDKMPERDLVSWNTMIHGYASLGDMGSTHKPFDTTSEKRQQSNEALRLFHEMQLANVVPDKVTIISVLSACGNLGALGMGKMVDEYIQRNRIDIEMKLGTSLLDMYAKCGDIDNSLKKFDCMNTKDIFTWTVMIMGLANHGLGEVALDYFSKMITEGIKPNDITFVGVLSACSHTGLVDQGRTYFKSMRCVYGVTPKIEHYGCMIDILGRAGLLEEARELIGSMPFAPDAIVWRAFLGACRIHKNVELAEEAVVNLLELEPYVDGNFVLVSNIYSQAKKWDRVVNTRRMMKNVNIQKFPGSSSIEVDNAVYEFLSGDKSHPKSKEIYQMLAEVLDRVKHAGYEPLIDSTVQDFDEQEKQQALAYHSEKLAIALGLLSTAPATPIRIFKNLRVCDDCHLAIKFISKVYNRKIVVRDRNRFHHFDQGSCSCKDYW
ncbi:Pentatricopeptide repeat-containing protein [Quillaja saponaria]|uniref:Pentatricopeptide repeat-containing protein n=1 Tax=Quillaja saponaria TaxID=32244 RepID=A0AAD7KV26_QUISA|nr:Pentatricopeptide repeat-containing protein [Quillaja saponaria]